MLFPINYHVWARYWDLLEHHGLNADNVGQLAGFLASPILVLGSGQGLLSQRLARAGHDVCSVDRSAEMAELARRRRGVMTLVCDALDLDLGQQFGTVLVTTGVISDALCGGPFLPRLLRVVHRHLTQDGRAIIAYFRVSPWTHVARNLGLYGQPSKNVLFWRAHGDLALAEHLFADSTNRAHIVHAAFDAHRTALDRHMTSIVAIGERYHRLSRRSPEDFIGSHSGYYPFPLRRKSESVVHRTLRDQRMATVATVPMNDGDTRVLVCERIEA